ncbi:MAG TPA: hypothetical protein VMH05_23140 [Bryobacteraceae bacterium]|nr:hypothetical protein [Bryobacteraceae bacterium]
MPLALLALNVYIARNLFALEYSQLMGSIEAAYISISRYMLENWRDLTWFPLWYGGIPFQNTYPPLLHALVAGFAAVAGVSPARAHHAVSAIFYCLGPVAVYFLALRLTSSRWFSFWAGLVYSVLSPSAFLMPSIHQDLGTYWTLRRLHVLMVYGEGPHIAALTLLPLALLALDWALVKRKPAAYLVAALSMDAVALTNWLGSFALAVAVAAYLVATSWNGKVPNWHKRWLISGALALLAYLIASPWIPPSTIGDIRYNAQYVGPYQHVYEKSVLYLALGLTVIASAKLGFRLLRVNAALQFFLLLTLLIGGINLAEEWFGIALVPQPHRYQLEMEMAICLVAVFLLKPLFDRLSRRLRMFAALAAVVVSIPLVRWDRQYAKLYIKPVDINTTVEFQTAKWLDSHFTNARVMMPGTISYWLNAFGDTPQFGGGFDQGIVNRVQPMVAYQIGAAPGSPEETAKISMIWFKAYGIAALGVQGPKSRGIYKPFLASSRFRGMLREAMRDGDDAIALVPGVSSLAHVIPAEAIVRGTPINGNDVTEVGRYVDALGAPPANLRWTSRHSVEIEANLRPGDVISFQEAYHPGWHATLNGLPLRISRDGLGQMIVNTDFAGDAKVELAYDGGLEMKLARILSWSSLAGCVIWLLISKRQNTAR